MTGWRHQDGWKADPTFWPPKLFEDFFDFFQQFLTTFWPQKLFKYLLLFFSSFSFLVSKHISYFIFCKGHNITTAVLTKYFQMQCNAILLHKTDINLGCVCVCTAVICFRFKFFEVESGNLCK